MPRRTSSHPSAQELAAFRLGTLQGRAAETIARHLETCGDCPKEGLQQGQPVLAQELIDHPKYRFLRQLGKGGMGEVWLAHHQLMDRQVAVKVLDPSLFSQGDAIARFQLEMRAPARLDHPNIVRAFDAEQAGRLHLLVMEYIEGQSLHEMVERQGHLSIAQACLLACQAALGLQHAHEQQLVHRDIKPANLMVTREGQLKILDFGLARLARGRQASQGLTQQNTFMGTPEYMAPEQARDAMAADARADIYSLGCTLYTLLTGKPPFVRDTMLGVAMAHLDEDPVPLREHLEEVPPELDALVLRMLAKDPADRPQNAREVARVLKGFASRGERSAPPPPIPTQTSKSRSVPPPLPVPEKPRGFSLTFWCTTLGLALVGVGVSIGLILALPRLREEKTSASPASFAPVPTVAKVAKPAKTEDREQPPRASPSPATPTPKPALPKAEEKAAQDPMPPEREPEKPTVPPAAETPIVPPVKPAETPIVRTPQKRPTPRVQLVEAAEVWRAPRRWVGTVVRVQGKATIRLTSERYLVTFLGPNDLQISRCSLNPKQAGTLPEEDLRVMVTRRVTLEGKVKMQGGGQFTLDPAEVIEVKDP